MTISSSPANPRDTSASSASAPGKPRRAGKTAILVIHGIGEQNPYETLDSFAQGFALYFNKLNPSNKALLHPERIRHKNWTQAAVHLKFKQDATPNGLRQLSLFEFYWAPYTEGKMTYRSVLGWLARTSLTPLRYLTDNLQMMLELEKRNRRASEAQGEPKTLAARAVYLVFREALRIFFVYLPIPIGVGGLTYFLGKSPAALIGIFPSLWKAFAAENHKAGVIVSAMCAVMFVVMLCFFLVELWSWARRMGDTIERTAENIWAVLAFFTAAGFAAVAWLIILWTKFDFHPYASTLLKASTLYPVAAVLLALLLRRVLVDYVADIAVYCTADAKSAYYVTREAILKSSTRSLGELLMNMSWNFDQVIVAGHSLGSVIAYDTINKMLSKVWATPDPIGQAPQPPLELNQLDKLKGLVTFGSPLDKIYYFFREHVTSSQAIRAQILSFLYSYKRRRSGRQYGDMKFSYGPPPPRLDTEPFEFPLLGGDFRWLNVWSRMDPVSGPLNFYELKEADRLHRWYPFWGVAHLRYWSDLKFYGFIARKLL
jgi:hypothetical protein